MPDTTPPRRVNRRKLDQLLDGARHVFMSEGYEGASVDAIAASAGVSKATLYSYFPDKRELFREVIDAECRKLAEQAFDFTHVSESPSVVLTRAATRLGQFMLSDFGRQIYRVSVAEANRFPELGNAFYEAGPELAHSRMTAYLGAATSRGELAISADEIGLAADQFARLCRPDQFYRVLLGLEQPPDADVIAAQAAEAVATFLARFGADNR